MYQAKLMDIVRRDPRFAYEAYEFVFLALAFTQKQLGRMPREKPAGETEVQYHVSGPELLAGIRDLALREFGFMARVVFKMWGINRTVDFGAIVFNLVQEKLMSKTDQDSLADFDQVYDLDTVLVEGFRIQLDEVE